MGDGHLIRRAGREFANNLLWIIVAFGALATIFVAATDLPLLGTMAFVGAAAAVMAAIVTGVGLGINAHDETPVGAEWRLARWRGLGWRRRR